MVRCEDITECLEKLSLQSTKKSLKFSISLGQTVGTGTDKHRGVFALGLPPWMTLFLIKT